MVKLTEVRKECKTGKTLSFFIRQLCAYEKNETPQLQKLIRIHGGVKGILLRATDIYNDMQIGQEYTTKRAGKEYTRVRKPSEDIVRRWLINNQPNQKQTKMYIENAKAGK
ncbi:MAG: hypothetical protein NC083_08830 [Muribaculum sp.]|nr:hypothetical protein [Muribaculum sp.]